MQLAGHICFHCRQRISQDADGRCCPSCGRVVHLACAERILNTFPSDCCYGCGGPATPVQRAKLREGADKDAKIAQGYRGIVLGVALVIAGVLGPMCCTGLPGEAAIAVSSMAIIGGAVLIVAGYLRSRG